MCRGCLHLAGLQLPLRVRRTRIRQAEDSVTSGSKAAGEEERKKIKRIDCDSQNNAFLLCCVGERRLPGWLLCCISCTLLSKRRSPSLAQLSAVAVNGRLSTAAVCGEGSVGKTPAACACCDGALPGWCEKEGDCAWRHGRRLW